MNTGTNGNSLKHVVLGDGLPIILIHGLAASAYDWAALMPELKLAGYRAFAVDLLGHGDSLKPDAPSEYTTQGVYASLESWIDSLALDQPCILVGHSLGGYLSLQFTLNRPESVRGMVLIDPLYKRTQIMPMLRFLNRRPSLGARLLHMAPINLIDFFLGWDPTSGVDFSPQARLQIAIDYKRASPHILNITNTTQDLSTALPDISAPTRVIWGTQDLTLRPSTFPPLVSALPQGKGFPIPGCGHQPHIGSPQKVNPLVLEFLQELQVDGGKAAR